MLNILYEANSSPAKCLWKEDDLHAAYDTACDESYVFEYGFRQHREAYTYCPNCGREIELAPVAEEVDDET